MDTLNLSTENDLAGIYRQFIEMHPIQSTGVVAGHRWLWIDSSIGSETVLLLPGFMGEAETSFLYVLALESCFRVISITYPPSIGKIDALCDGMVAWMDKLELQHVTVLGGSSSGFVAQALVRRHPQRVSRLILTHTGLPILQRARTARVYLGLLHCLPFGLIRWLMQISIYGYFPHSTPAHAFWRGHFREVVRRQSREALWNRFVLLADFHSHYHFQPADLVDWPGKVLIMEMSRDSLSTPFEQEAMRELYPQAHLHIFPKAAHYDAVEQPAEQILVIKNFLLNSEAAKYVK